jgi:hypothetical protein
MVLEAGKLKARWLAAYGRFLLCSPEAVQGLTQQDRANSLLRCLPLS